MSLKSDEINFLKAIYEQMVDIDPQFGMVNEKNPGEKSDDFLKRVEQNVEVFFKLNKKFKKHFENEILRARSSRPNFLKNHKSKLINYIFKERMESPPQMIHGALTSETKAFTKEEIDAFVEKLYEELDLDNQILEQWEDDDEDFRTRVRGEVLDIIRTANLSKLIKKENPTFFAIMQGKKYTELRDVYIKVLIETTIQKKSPHPEELLKESTFDELKKKNPSKAYKTKSIQAFLPGVNLDEIPIFRLNPDARITGANIDLTEFEEISKEEGFTKFGMDDSILESGEIDDDGNEGRDIYEMLINSDMKTAVKLINKFISDRSLYLVENHQFPPTLMKVTGLNKVDKAVIVDPKLMENAKLVERIINGAPIPDEWRDHLSSGGKYSLRNASIVTSYAVGNNFHTSVGIQSPYGSYLFGLGYAGTPDPSLPIASTPNASFFSRNVAAPINLVTSATGFQSKYPGLRIPDSPIKTLAVYDRDYLVLSEKKNEIKSINLVTPKMLENLEKFAQDIDDMQIGVKNNVLTVDQKEKVYCQISSDESAANCAKLPEILGIARSSLFGVTNYPGSVAPDPILRVQAIEKLIEIDSFEDSEFRKVLKYIRDGDSSGTRNFLRQYAPLANIVSSIKNTRKSYSDEYVSSYLDAILNPPSDTALSYRGTEGMFESRLAPKARQVDSSDAAKAPPGTGFGFGLSNLFSNPFSTKPAPPVVPPPPPTDLTRTYTDYRADQDADQDEVDQGPSTRRRIGGKNGGTKKGRTNKNKRTMKKRNARGGKRRSSKKMVRKSQKKRS